jgi:hypothetical protein
MLANDACVGTKRVKAVVLAVTCNIVVDDDADPEVISRRQRAIDADHGM